MLTKEQASQLKQRINEMINRLETEQCYDYQEYFEGLDEVIDSFTESDK